jgi:hypothetical protein
MRLLVDKLKQNTDLSELHISIFVGMNNAGT